MLHEKGTGRLASATGGPRGDIRGIGRRKRSQGGSIFSQDLHIDP